MGQVGWKERAGSSRRKVGRKVRRVYVWRKGRLKCINTCTVRVTEAHTVTLPMRQGLRRSGEHRQHMALIGADGVCDALDASWLMAVPGADPVPEAMFNDGETPPEVSDDEEDAEQLDESVD